MTCSHNSSIMVRLLLSTVLYHFWTCAIVSSRMYIGDESSPGEVLVRTLILFFIFFHVGVSDNNIFHL
jgi:hypothetical protein